MDTHNINHKYYLPRSMRKQNVMKEVVNELYNDFILKNNSNNIFFPTQNKFYLEHIIYDNALLDVDNMTDLDFTNYYEFDRDR